MPRKQPTPTDKPQPKKVHCTDCRRFSLDTEGRSFSAVTGEYFMGRCPKLHSDGIIFYDNEHNPIAGHVFADKARVCNDYILKF